MRWLIWWRILFGWIGIVFDSNCKDLCSINFARIYAAYYDTIKKERLRKIKEGFQE